MATKRQLKNQSGVNFEPKITIDSSITIGSTSENPPSSKAVAAHVQLRLESLSIVAPSYITNKFN